MGDWDVTGLSKDSRDTRLTTQLLIFWLQNQGGRLQWLLILVLSWLGRSKAIADTNTGLCHGTPSSDAAAKLACAHVTLKGAAISVLI